MSGAAAGSIHTQRRSRAAASATSVSKGSAWMSRRKSFTSRAHPYRRPTKPLSNTFGSESRGARKPGAARPSSSDHSAAAALHLCSRARRIQRSRSTIAMASFCTIGHQGLALSLRCSGMNASARVTTVSGCLLCGCTAACRRGGRSLRRLTCLCEWARRPPTPRGCAAAASGSARRRRLGTRPRSR